MMSEMRRGLRVWCSVCVESSDVVSSSGAAALFVFGRKRLRTACILSVRGSCGEKKFGAEIGVAGCREMPEPTEGRCYILSTPPSAHNSAEAQQGGQDGGAEMPRAILLKTKSTPTDPYDTAFRSKTPFIPVFVPVLEHARVNPQELRKILQHEPENHYSALIITSQRAVEALGDAIHCLSGTYPLNCHS
jgi:hypothetical protein